MPAPTINLTLTNIETGKLATIEDLETEVNEALAYLHGVANPEDRIRAEDAADQAKGFAEDAAESASEAESSATDASLAEQQAQAAAVLAGAPIAPAFPTDDTETAALPSPFLFIAPEGVQSWTHSGTLASLVQGDYASRVEFDDAAALLAYNGPALPVGLIIRTRKEGFAYNVVSIGEHRTTAGGMKLYALPGENGAVDVAALGAVQNTDAGAIIQAALGFGLPKIAISGRYGVTAISATLAAPLTVICNDAEIYRIGAGSSRLVTINTNGHDIKTEGSLTVDADDKAPEAIRFSNLLSTHASINLDRVVARNVYTRAADGTIGAIGISLFGTYEPIRIKTAEAHRVNREAGTNAPGSNGSFGLVILASGGFEPKDVQIENLVLDTISCDDAVGAAGNTDCDGANINLAVASLTGLLTDKRYSVRIGDIVARNCKGRVLKTQAGETILNSLNYTHENLASINGGFSLVNPQGAVKTNIDNVNCKFKDNGVSPFNGAYQGSIVGLYDDIDRSRPQFIANISNINVVSDYVGSGLAQIVSAANGGATAAGILNISNIAADADVRAMLSLPANGGAHRVNITNAYARNISGGFAEANAQNDALLLRAENCGHFGSEVFGVYDLFANAERSYNFSAINLTGIRSSVPGIGPGSRGAGVLRAGSIAAPEGSINNAGVLNIASISAPVNVATAFRALGARSDGTLFIMRTSANSFALFGLVNETITVIYETPGFFSFGTGADPGTALRINVWVSRSTGQNILWVNNRVSETRFVDVLALG